MRERTLQARDLNKHLRLKAERRIREASKQIAWAHAQGASAHSMNVLAQWYRRLEAAERMLESLSASPNAVHRAWDKVDLVAESLKERGR